MAASYTNCQLKLNCHELKWHWSAGPDRNRPTNIFKFFSPLVPIFSSAKQSYSKTLKQRNEFARIIRFYSEFMPNSGNKRDRWFPIAETKEIAGSLVTPKFSKANDWERWEFGEFPLFFISVSSAAAPGVVEYFAICANGKIPCTSHASGLPSPMAKHWAHLVAWYRRWTSRSVLLLAATIALAMTSLMAWYLAGPIIPT